ncbi:hypothetical protein JXB31_05190 [Candidatus Woesearchaeota archaeon]|nr:hypothetical protein [Candidatus Woesearchaeota archaeon]
MNRRGVELSVNFFVMLVLAIMVFALGTQITLNIINQSNKMVVDINEKTKQDITDVLIRSGGTVAMPDSKKVIARKGNDIFAVGIKNTHPQAEYFKFDVECIKAFKTETKETICDVSADVPCTSICGNWWMNRNTVYHIEKQQTEVEGIFIQVPKEDQYGDQIEKGQYIFSFKVNAYTYSDCSDLARPSQLDTGKTFYVNVNK